jgi:hypothetical protein
MSLIDIPEELDQLLRTAARREGREYTEFVLETLAAGIQVDKKQGSEALNSCSSGETATRDLTSAPAEVRAVLDDPEAPLYLKRILTGAYSLSDAAVERLPPDGAANHDHYLYGSPKREP